MDARPHRNKQQLWGSPIHPGHVFEPCICVRQLWENSVLITAELASLKPNTTEFRCFFFRPQEASTRVGEKLQPSIVLCLPLSLFCPSLSNHSLCSSLHIFVHCNPWLLESTALFDSVLRGMSILYIPALGQSQ